MRNGQSSANLQINTRSLPHPPASSRIHSPAFFVPCPHDSDERTCPKAPLGVISRHTAQKLRCGRLCRLRLGVATYGILCPLGRTVHIPAALPPPPRKLGTSPLGRLRIRACTNFTAFHSTQIFLFSLVSFAKIAGNWRGKANIDRKRNVLRRDSLCVLYP